MWGDKGAAPPTGASALPTPNRQKIMGKYLVNTYSTIRKTNGYTFRYEGFTKVLSENVVKIAKQANKEVGYKYVGRDRDMYDNIFTKYIKLSEILPEEKVFYKYQITRLK